MKKILCMMAALLMCLSLAMPAMAASDTFVPSIGYKDGPECEDAVLGGEYVGGCIVVSSIKQAKEKTTDIYQEERDLLLELYEKIETGAMKLPMENSGYVVRELVDVSFVKSGCVEDPHGHEEDLLEEGTTITVTFDLGVWANTHVQVLVYVDGQWVAPVRVVNNGNGTVTCEFENIGPVAFCVDPSVETESPKTGDTAGQGLWIWILLLGVSAAALVLLVKNRSKFIK